MSQSTLPATTTLDRPLRDAICHYHVTLADADFLAAARLAANLGEGDCRHDLEYMLNVVYQYRTARQTTLLQRMAYQTILAWATDATDQDLAFIDLIATLDEIDPARQACSTPPKQRDRGGLFAVAHSVRDMACFAWRHPRLVGSVCTLASATAAVISHQAAQRKARKPREVQVLVTVHLPR